MRASAGEAASELVAVLERVFDRDADVGDATQNDS
jgi:hypothetical protein